MTHLLEDAIAKLEKLPPGQQDEVASWLLAELDAESRWQIAFSASQDLLASLADEALAEDEGEKTQPLDPESL